MSKDLTPDEKQTVKQPQPEVEEKTPKKQPAKPEIAGIINLQKRVGNRAVQRMLAQRKSGDGSFDLDDKTAGRINQARGGGQALDGAVQKQMSQSMGHDFSGVKVHTSSEADSLSQDLNAKAFTTGQDIFFKSGEYNPGSSGGQELIAHELSHVVQQSTGQVPSSGQGMTVRPPNDAFEQEADATAAQLASQSPAGDVQRQEDEEELQMKPLQRQEDEEELQMKPLQRQEDEEELQMKADQ